MNDTERVFNIIGGLILLLLMIVTIYGLSSFNTAHSYEIVNQYGENIRIWGAGIYAHDSYFKAPIFIGSDFTILICGVPLVIVIFFRDKFIGYVLLRMLLRICMVIGIMLPVQTFFQLVAGISIPIPALITKVFIFILLAVFAAFFDYRLKHGTEYAEELS